MERHDENEETTSSRVPKDAAKSVFLRPRRGRIDDGDDAGAIGSAGGDNIITFGVVVFPFAKPQRRTGDQKPKVLFRFFVAEAEKITEETALDAVLCARDKETTTFFPASMRPHPRLV